MLLITKDGDFRDSHFLNGSPARVVRLTLGNLSNTDLVALVLQHWSAVRDISAREDCYIELSLKGVIRLPPAGSAS